jgi:hypothetical protein
MYRYVPAQDYLLDDPKPRPIWKFQQLLIITSTARRITHNLHRRSKLTLLVFDTQPNSNPRSLFIDITHLPHLVVPFLLILLIDTQSISPQEYFVAFRSQMFESLPEVVSDRQFVIVQEDLHLIFL